jgi:hypothetical protein
VTIFAYVGGSIGSPINDLGEAAIRLPLPPLTERAEALDAAMSGLVVDDDAGSLDVPGLRAFAINETDCSVKRLYSGYVTNRHILRGDDKRQSLRISGKRQWDVDLVDYNMTLSRRVIRGSDGNRPAETDVERAQWIIASDYTPTVTDAGLIQTSGPVDMDPVDYRGRYPTDVLADCGNASGKNYFVYFDEPTNHPAFAYFFGTSSLYSSTLRLSNVASDIDSSTTFAATCELYRDPSRVFSGVYLKYDGGSVFRSNSTTEAAFQRVEVSIDEPDIKSRTKAIALADKYLTDGSAEDETLTITLQLPSTHVNLIQPGQRLQVKFSHIPGYTSFTYTRVVSRTVSQAADTDKVYDVVLECKNPKLIGRLGSGSSPVSAGTGNNNVPPPAPTDTQAGLRFNLTPHLTAFAFGDASKHANFVVAYTNSISGTPVDIMPGDSPYTAQGSFSADSTAGDTTGLVIHSSNVIQIGADVPMNTPLYLVARYTDLGGGTAYTNGGTTVAFSPPSGSWTGPPAGLSIVTTAGAVSSGGSGSVFTLCSFIVTDGSSPSAPAFGQPATPEQIAGDGSTTTFTTNYPFVEGTLQVFVGDVLVTPSSVTGTTGSFTLPLTAPTGTNIVVFYYGTGGTATGATNTTTLTAGPTHVPTSMLGSGTASATTFLRGDQTWAVPSAASVSFGSNSNSVGSANAPGASSSNARADHVHQGVHQLTSNGSNALFENVNVAAGSGIALGVSGQTVTITNTGSGGGGGGGGTGTLTRSRRPTAARPTAPSPSSSSPTARSPSSATSRPTRRPRAAARASGRSSTRPASPGRGSTRAARRSRRAAPGCGCRAPPSRPTTGTCGRRPCRRSRTRSSSTCGR